ncbi:hypothetical protein FRC03_011700 [Tulasnella sp. 419]|nr:hypothetical protein FRC03_011700 [Tulasnella sp. 419]
MADEDRAAKAARAKALLKSHQKKKKAGATGTPSTPSNLSPLTAGRLGGDVTPSIGSASALFSPPASDAGGTGDDKSELAWLSEKEKTAPVLSKLSSSTVAQDHVNGVNGTTSPPPKQSNAEEPSVPESITPKSPPLKSSVSRPATPRNGIVAPPSPTRQLTSPQNKNRTFSPPPRMSSPTNKERASFTEATYERRREEDRRQLEFELRKRIGEEEEAKRVALERQMATSAQNLRQEFKSQAQENAQRHRQEIESLQRTHQGDLKELEQRLRNEFSSQREREIHDQNMEFTRRRQEDEQKWKEERDAAVSSAVAPLQATTQNHQQTISLLVADKNNLTAELERLEGIEQRSQNSDRLLEEGRMLVESLTSKVAELEADLHDASSRAMSSSIKEKELSDRLQDSERELELSRRTLSDTRQQLAQSRARIKELEEQIENDDRLEQMEKSLRTVQDRADSLELQLSKTKQTLGKTKAERDGLEARISSQKESETAWSQKYEALNQDHSDVKQSLSSLATKHSTLEAEHASLQSQHAKSSQEVASLQAQLKKLRGEFDEASRALQMAQSAVTASNRRAERGEEALKTLQKENVELVESLNEIRNKTVELNDDKVNLSDKIENLERGVKSRDDKIRELEGLIDQAYARVDELVAELAGVDKVNGKQRNEADRVNKEQLDLIHSLEQQKKDLEVEIQDLKAERGMARATIDQLESNMDRAHAEKEQRLKELESMGALLADREANVDDIDGVLTRMREEVESLRAELVAKDDEHLRVTSQLDEALAKLASASSSKSNGQIRNGSLSLSDELMDSLRQQHELEISTARSQIRQLETAVFQEQAKTHTLQRRVTTLETELSQLKTKPERNNQSASHSSNTVLSSEGSYSGEYGRRAIPTSHVGLSPTILSLAAKKRGLGIDAGLSPDAQHKRNISLSMLRARIESEAKYGGAGASKTKSSKLGEVDGIEALEVRRPQFGDETHVFCCAACTGDVVVL